MNCSCGQGHATYGACLRAKNLRIGYCQSARGLDRTAQNRIEAECDSYKDARREGIQPGGTNPAAVRYAVEQSNKHGKAFNAERPLAHLPEE